MVRARVRTFLEIKANKPKKVAAMIAEDIINAQQAILPGYQIINDYCGDHGDPDAAN